MGLDGKGMDSDRAECMFSACMHPAERTPAMAERTFYARDMNDSRYWRPRPQWLMDQEHQCAPPTDSEGFDLSLSNAALISADDKDIGGEANDEADEDMCDDALINDVRN